MDLPNDITSYKIFDSPFAGLVSGGQTTVKLMLAKNYCFVLRNNKKYSINISQIFQILLDPTHDYNPVEEVIKPETEKHAP